MPRIVNNFNVVLGTKGYIEYLFQNDAIIVCNFPALDTLHDLGVAHQFTQNTDLKAALLHAKLAYARLSISSPDRFLIRTPLTALKRDARVRDSIVWLYKHLYKSFSLNTSISFIKKDGSEEHLRVTDPSFLELAIYSVVGQ